MGEGSSYLTVPIDQALPKPPDVTIEGQVPCGGLVAFTPVGATAMERRKYRLQFPVGQGVSLTLTRLRIQVPVFLEELELREQSVPFTETRKYETEEEAEHGRLGKEGQDNKSETIKQIAWDSPYERVLIDGSTYKREGTLVIREGHVRSWRSLLPVTVQVVVGLFGPDGEVWSQAFDV